MKSSILLSPVFAIAVCFGAFHPADGRAAERDGYSIEIKVTPKEGEAKITKVTGIALEQNWRVELPLTLSHSENPATVSLDFELAPGTVSINIKDFDLGSNQGATGHRRDFFDAELFFDFGKEKTICTTAAETISFTLTAPALEKAENAEAGDPSKANQPGAVDVSKLEVEFRHSDGRIYAHIYNPTELSITKVVVRVTADAAGDFKGFDRRYLGNIGLQPLSEDSMQIEARLPELPNGVEYQFALESAR